MPKYAFIGVVVAPLLLPGGVARADWRAPILGAVPILPARFTPMRYAVNQPSEPRTALDAEPPSEPVSEGRITWSAPLMDRRLNQAERTADIAPELQEAILRIEPMYDPTRLDGPDSLPRKGISAGTASMDNVFADRWRQLDPDPNVDVKVHYIADAWSMRAPPPCDSFSKRRSRGVNHETPALSDLTTTDCAVLQRGEARGFDEAPPLPIVVGTIDVPVFAAPLPGARMSSQDFWAMQRARIAAAQEQLRLRRTWNGTIAGINTDKVKTSGIEIGMLRR